MKRFGLLAIAAILLLPACGDDDATTTSPPTTAAPVTTAAPTTEAPGSSDATVTAEGFAFSPSELTVQVGTTVTWTNQDGLPHTTTGDDGLWDGSLAGGGGSFDFTFDTPGTFAYHCSIHPSMTATITVEG